MQGERAVTGAAEGTQRDPGRVADWGPGDGQEEAWEEEGPSVSGSLGHTAE